MTCFTDQLQALYSTSEQTWKDKNKKIIICPELKEGTLSVTRRAEECITSVIKQTVCQI